MWIKKTVSETELIEEALIARASAYAPYSGYRVGAALMTPEGKIYRGCNIENSSYGVTNCAERTALFKAVSEGERRFAAIAVVGGAEPEGEELSGYAYPCGICRQALREFSDPRELKVIVAKSPKEFIVKTLEDILPDSFGPEKLL